MESGRFDESSREESTPIDGAQMARLYEIGGDSLIGKMIQLFEENSPRQISDIHVFEEAGDWEGVFRSVHKLKSSAGNFGAHSLFRLCVDIEERIHHERTDDLSSNLRSLEIELDRVLKALMREKARINE
ncbi:MAG: Hpt domain-containing protein [Candidatus Omnitrophica bacterium]|nr:Hpt domain-containing protein [Candidatus Omnitrophota bacterium]